MNSNDHSKNPWLIVDRELMNARHARNAGNEGKARVCARRAVGQALFITGFSSIQSLDAIQSFINDQETPEEIRELGIPLLERVNEMHQLPSGKDLIENAKRIITFIQNVNM